MILLIITDTNICTACVTLEGILPSIDPPVRDFLRESFIYWGCGGQISSCRDYTIYAGNGTIGIPSFYLINPNQPQTSQAYASGASKAENFYSWLRRSLLTSTSPRITNPSSNQTINSSNFVAQGRSISTNVPIKTVKYSLNGLGWISLTVSATSNPDYGFQIPLTAKIGANQLRVYAIDTTGAYKSKTNVLNFNFNPNSTPVTPDITVNSSLNPSVYGQSVYFTATVSGSGGTPTGTVQFKTNDVNFGPAVPLSGGTATSASVSNLSAGNKTVTAGYSGDGSYTSGIRTFPGGQTVNKAVLTVTANNASKNVGDPNPPFTASYSGFVNGETAAVLSGNPSLTTTTTTGSGPGLYPISVAQGTLSAANYSFSFVNGTLTVNPLVTVPGDTNGDGKVDPTELNAVLANYQPGITNKFGLRTQDFRVEFNTNVAGPNWSNFGQFALYGFIQTNAPQGYYRLRLVP